MSIMMKTKTINRLKVVLVERQVTNKWLSEKMNLSTTTISRWCTNKTQPSLENLVEVAGILKVDVKDLIISTK
jgi:transcriptional regulator with XRE-family HTH domain